jgi:uncharacterized protein YprB with RNaseH-like and TPR domain
MKETPLKKPKILVFDIETTPNLGYVWGKWQQDVIEYKTEWTMLCFAYKWLGEKKTIAVGQNKFSEEILVRRLHSLFEEADIVIAHNGNSFDVKMCNAKFIEFGLDPPSFYKSIDTKLVAKRYFRFNSNKLDDLGNLLGLGRKIQTGGFQLWTGCMAGDKKSWDLMLKYNKQDVVLLEKVYLKLRPWMDNHPAINLLVDKSDACPKCGGGPLHKRGTVKYNKTTVVQRYQCQNCGGWSQSRTSDRTMIEFVN